jgi:hypothetical protein
MAYHVELTDRALRDLSIIYGRIGAESSSKRSGGLTDLRMLSSALKNTQTEPH